jgi:hypothetical protein
MTAWNDFVKKIYHEGKKSDKEYTFGKALSDASKRKSEMHGGTTSKKGGSPVGSSLKPSSVSVNPSYDGIDGQGITQGTGQSGPLTAALTAGGGKRRTKRRRSSKRKGGKRSRKTRRHRRK